ncbi:hydantoinase B/oxoprolinase family protein [Cryptosporangium sp. NPDC051539]|uniref:hydantoinase B/oxoprolinase family protein n=1 Tax=Cryptosporangium sp. NPDC051539 TaxID=3363962 RepID=UPI0037B03FBC
MASSADETFREVDPVTFEVIRHRLLGVVDEQAARLSAISGSKNVTEMSDFNVGIYLPDGAVAVMGRTILFHASSMGSMVRHVLADCAENPGINPGDMFVVNNPWKGAVHGPDMAIVAPIFADDELIFWSGGLMHMPDIGGMRHGGIGLDATESYQEGLLLPPIKLVEAGTIRSDVWNMILSQSRAAAAMALDLKGLMAANHAAGDGIGKLVQRYGVDELRTVMATLIRTSEDRMRRRLRELPDVTVKGVGYLEVTEGSSEVPLVAVTLTKTGDRMVLDFSGSTDQQPDAKNCTWAGLMAGISAALLPTIAYDIPWNAGLYEPLEVICPEGRVCNARKPAAVSGNIAGAAYEVQIATIAAVSKLLACSDEYLGEAEASPGGRPSMWAFLGLKDNGQQVVGFTLDNLASGGAAYHDHDGVAVQGHHDIERTNISNVESLEFDYPLLYLWRGLASESGAGRHRGGQSIGASYVPHKVKSFVPLGTQVFQVPDNHGAFGGLPGAQPAQVVVRGANIREAFAAGHIPTVDELSGTRTHAADLPGPLSREDVLIVTAESGAGWGDPLERPAGQVAADVRNGAVTDESARRHYRVELDATGEVDEVATAANRASLRQQRGRLAGKRRFDRGPASGPLTRVGPVGDRLQVVRDTGGDLWTRCSCGHVLAPAGENWRLYAATDVAPGAEVATTLTVHESVEFRRYFCPSCGLCHSVDLVPVGAPDPDDVRLALANSPAQPLEAR